MATPDSGRVEERQTVQRDIGRRRERDTGTERGRDIAVGGRGPKMSVDLEELRSKIAALGDEIKQLKSSSEPDTAAIGTAVAALLDAKRSCEYTRFVTPSFASGGYSQPSPLVFKLLAIVTRRLLFSQLPVTMAGSAWMARSGRSP